MPSIRDSWNSENNELGEFQALDFFISNICSISKPLKQILDLDCIQVSQPVSIING